MKKLFFSIFFALVMGGFFVSCVGSSAEPTADNEVFYSQAEFDSVMNSKILIRTKEIVDSVAREKEQEIEVLQTQISDRDYADSIEEAEYTAALGARKKGVPAKTFAELFSIVGGSAKRDTLSNVLKSGDDYDGGDILLNLSKYYTTHFSSSTPLQELVEPLKDAKTMSVNWEKHKAAAKPTFAYFGEVSGIGAQARRWLPYFDQKQMDSKILAACQVYYEKFKNEGGWKSSSDEFIHLNMITSGNAVETLLRYSWVERRRGEGGNALIDIMAKITGELAKW